MFNSKRYNKIVTQSITEFFYLHNYPKGAVCQLCKLSGLTIGSPDCSFRLKI